MAFYVLEIPLLVTCLVAVAAHSMSHRFWAASLGVGLFTAVAYFAYVTALLGFQVHTMVISFAAGLTGIGVATLVGIPFLLDRRIQKRDAIQGE